MNALFTADTTLAAVPPADITGGGTGVFDTIVPKDIPTGEANTTFDDLVYGFNPANLTNDPGAYDVFNGALARFDDAYNIGLYALENNGALLPTADFATDLFGNPGSLSTELAGLTATQAVSDLLGNGFSDLLGYFCHPVAVRAPQRTPGGSLRGFRFGRPVPRLCCSGRPWIPWKRLSPASPGDSHQQFRRQDLHGAGADSELLHHRPHRPRQVHAC